METQSENPVLPFKIQELIEIIMKNKSLSFIDALHYLYSSELYSKFFDDSAKLWYISSLNLYEMLKEEKRIQKRVNDSKKELFTVFCLESYKEYYNTSAMQVFALFTYYGVFDYLSEGYEVLHTQGKVYIASDINRFIKKQKR